MSELRNSVMKKPGGAVSATLRPNILQRKCACGSHKPGGEECDSCKKGKGSAQLQRAAVNASSVKAVPPIVHDVLRSPGQSLDAQTRAFFEPRFGQDFSQVRVHTDSRAAASAHAVNALGYTVGRNIVWGAGRYQPHTRAGSELLAHELTHVVQQGFGLSGGVDSLALGPVGDHAEREADEISGRVVNGGARATGNSQVSPRLQRLPLNPELSAGGSHLPGEKRHGSTLSYRDATELAACIRIMGEANSAQCREEVLGDKPAVEPVIGCAKTHTIRDDVYQAIEDAWAKSGHGGKKVREHGGLMVTDRTGQSAIRTGKGRSGSIVLPEKKRGDVIEGTFHTHPYSAKEGSTLGVSFSGGDIKTFLDGPKREGKLQYVGSGTCIFAVETLNAEEQAACKKRRKRNTTKIWNKGFKDATGTFQEKVEKAVGAAIAGCGLCYYKACRKDDTTPIPKTMDLVV